MKKRNANPKQYMGCSARCFQVQCNERRPKCDFLIRRHDFKAPFGAPQKNRGAPKGTLKSCLMIRKTHLGRQPRGLLNVSNIIAGHDFKEE